MPPDLRCSPLHDAHLALGAKMVPFGGWEMPLSYPAGTLAEHHACRESAVVFDVSHLGTLEVRGPGAFAALQWAFTNDLTRIEPGRAQYTHLLDPTDGSVLDDIIVWWIAQEAFEVMPNASNTSRVADALVSELPGFETDDVTANRVMLAVQGPQARERVARISPEAASVGRFRVHDVVIDDVAVRVAGTGYTGEDGLELAIPRAGAESLWQQLIGVGIQPAGLGARDTLRLEAGLPLHGHELGPGITPLQADLGWVVRFDKGDFRGRDALIGEATTGPPRLLQGIVTESRRPPREGQTVLHHDQPIGVVSSGNFSPMLGKGVALAFLERRFDEGTPVTIEARGSLLNGVVAQPPFLRSA